MVEASHFLSFTDLEQAETHLGFVALGRRVRRDPMGIRVHIRDHRGREVVPTLEIHFDEFVLSQQRPGGPAATRLALEESYGADRVATEVGTHPAGGYELGEEPDRSDPDPRQPSVVSWADGEFFYMLASDRIQLSSLLDVANSLYE